MNSGKTMFAQIMEFVPWTSFTRIVARHGGDSGVRCLSRTERFRAMAFAQLTYRESLRDIEACLLVNQSKLYGMGFRTLVRRSTDANEGRDWRIWADLAAVLIRRARKLYCNDSFGVELANTVDALDATTIDLCLSLFLWAPFRSTKAQSSCIRCWICTAAFLPSSISATARLTRSVCWTFCPSRPAHST